MKTKDKILNKTIEMYNALGVNNVSSRDISKELGISHGNLEYHFKNKSEMLNAIYKKMKAEISNIYEVSDIEIDPIQHFQVLLDELEKLQQKYLFFNLDLLEISRKFPEVKLNLETTLSLRKNQTAILINRLVETDYLKSEPFEDCYLHLHHMIRILITFWKPQEEILVSFSSLKENEMSLHVWSLIQPHLTEKGLDAFNKLVKNK